ncbi:MAG: putative porin [Flavobacteriaceae bacterium]
MYKTFLLILFLCSSALVFSQNEKSKKEKKEKPSVTLYKIVSAKQDTTYVDTSLTIQRDYKFNYLRKDGFELQEFSNVGQPYNNLAYEFDKINLKPLFAAQAHHFNYKEINDMQYYYVPTPLTELYFKTAFKQGQQLDAFFTINTSEQFNFSAAFKGVQSLGTYQHQRTSTGDFRFTTNYHTKNRRYNFIAHVTANDLTNEENGGLTEESIALFQSADSDFKDRGRLDVNFENAKSELKGFRAYFKHEYKLIAKKDSTDQNNLTIGNVLSFEDKSYLFIQNNPFDGYGESYKTSDLWKKATLEDFNVQGYARFENDVIGSLTAFIGYTDYNYGYDSKLILDEGEIVNRLKGNQVQAGASYKKTYKGFELYGEGAINISGDFDGNFFKVGASYLINNEYTVSADLKLHSVAPNFNFLLFQSDYVNYNWQNDYNNVKTQQLNVDFTSEKIINFSLSYTGIDEYAYFTIKANDSTPTPHQYGDRVDYVKVKVQKDIRYKKFGLENTILYQNALSGEEVLKLPQFITRNTLYFEDRWFKKAIFMQTGATFKYYSDFFMNGYDPVLGEFYVQNTDELGGYPQFDLFFNARVQQIRFYFKYENFNALFSGTNDYFSAPGYSYRDAVVRFGIVWNFFM